MHYAGVVLTGEDVAGAAHVSGELIDFVDVLDHGASEILVAQIAENELVGVCGAVFMLFDIDATDPKAFGFESFDEVAADEATGAVHENSFGHVFGGFGNVWETHGAVARRLGS